MSSQNEINRQRRGDTILEWELNIDISDDERNQQFLDYEKVVVNSKLFYDKINTTKYDTRELSNIEAEGKDCS